MHGLYRHWKIGKIRVINQPPSLPRDRYYKYFHFLPPFVRKQCLQIEIPLVRTEGHFIVKALRARRGWVFFYCRTPYLPLIRTRLRFQPFFKFFFLLRTKPSWKMACVTSSKNIAQSPCAWKPLLMDARLPAFAISNASWGRKPQWEWVVVCFLEVDQ